LQATRNTATAAVAITGAAGYVGSALAHGMRRAGREVIEFRRTGGNDRATIRSFRLEDEPAPEIFLNIETLVHCAYDFQARGWDEIQAVNVDGTRRLFRAAAGAGVKRFILISSISAFRGCRSLYGRAKLEMEAIAAAQGAAIIRPGLVFGERPGGMVAALLKLALLPGLVPLVGDGHYLLYAAHEEDLCQLLLRIADGPTGLAGEPIVAAHRRAYTLREIMVALAARRNRRPRFVPIPAGAIDLTLHLMEASGLRPRLRRDSLLSLLNQDPAPDFEPLQRVGLEFRPFC
jgi:nucleoside-diphosphate-sugar epimerase